MAHPHPNPHPLHLAPPPPPPLYPSSIPLMLLQCAMSLVKEEGALSLYKGLEAQLWRNAVWNGVYFGLVGWIKEHVVPKREMPASTHRLYDFGAGVLGGSKW